ncbi:MAG: aminopeptidase [Clostridia bacterium]|nr:aminopeptidase [Clostridia bacterium]
MEENFLKKFAETVLKIGVNLQENQGLEIICPVEKSDVAVALTEAAYRLNAKIVNVRWECESVDRLNYLNADTETLTDVPKWFIDSKNYLVKKGFCYCAIAAEDPSAFLGVPPEKLAAAAKARGKALKNFYESVMSNGIRWCVVSVPTKNWAKKVFPNSVDPENELLGLIEKTMRLDAENPVLAWEKHIKTLNKRAEFLNSHNFEYLHFTNSIGTDFTVGLCEDHTWISAEEKAKDGLPFVANMPTEEVFTAPHRLKAKGTVKSAMPLCYEGQIIDGFSLTFKNGKIVDFSAEKGYDTLKHLIETDSGTRRLGEVALIGKNSPIAKSKVLFFNTLFDENASCHIALGKGYPTTVKNSETLSKKALTKKGLNDSIEHVDFMIGTADLKIDGIKKDKTAVPLFRNGDWII